MRSFFQTSAVELNADSLFRMAGESKRVGCVTPGRFTQDNLPDHGVPGAAWADDILRPGVLPATSPVRQTNYYGSV
ncbi:MAG TPA: hypothetical protein VFY29_11260 [Terriglobia bacterium]|nr:hypothetical protein [Terriglobia bacterium]